MATSLATQFGRLYSFVRSRQLEGSYPGDRATGVWITTRNRVERGWGAVSEQDWPYSAALKQWPPLEPPGLDEKAKKNRLLRYQRICHSLECKYALPCCGPVNASFEITSQWFDAKEGIIEMPVDGTEMVGSHGVLITGYSDEEEVFNFQNTWGPEWGDAGFGKLPYEYFDRWMLDVYVCDRRRMELPSMGSSSIADLQWSDEDFAGRRVHVHEIYDYDSDERLAWAFAMPNEYFLDVEELFVRPQYRSRGYGTRLLRSLHKMAGMAHLPLRVFVPYADCGAGNLRVAERLLSKEGCFLTTGSVRWAPYTALSKPVAVRIPPPPGLVRQGGDKQPSMVSPVGEKNGINGIQTTDVVGTGKKCHEPQFTRLIPTSSPPEKTNDNPWVIVLSDWPAGHDEELLRLVESAGDEARRAHRLVLIVDDSVVSLDTAYRSLLDELIEAGAFFLEPESDDEAKTADGLNRFIAVRISAALRAVGWLGSARGAARPGVTTASVMALTRGEE